MIRKRKIQTTKKEKALFASTQSVLRIDFAISDGKSVECMIGPQTDTSISSQRRTQAMDYTMTSGKSACPQFSGVGLGGECCVNPAPRFGRLAAWVGRGRQMKSTGSASFRFNYE